MTLSPFFSDTAAKASVEAMVALANGGTLKIYTGSQPTDANTAVGAQTLLGTLSFANPAFGSASASGTAPTRKSTCTANTITDDTSADNTGNAAWFRILKSDGTTVVMDGSVGTTGCDLNLATTSLVSGEDISVTSFTVSQPQ